MNSVEDLDVFKLAHQLALKAYLRPPKHFPEKNYLDWEAKSVGLLAPSA